MLNEGDEVAGFRVVHAPGHARGEVIFFRDSDRVAICGDVIRNMSYATGRPMLAEPPEIFTYDPAENRRSIRKLADLEPVADPARPRPGGHRHRRLRALRRRLARVESTRWPTSNRARIQGGRQGLGRGRRGRHHPGIFVGNNEASGWFGGGPSAYVAHPEAHQAEVVSVFRITPRDE